MKVFSLERFGLEHLRLAERRDPAPGPGRVVLDMRAWSLNYRDLLVVRGEYDPRLALPMVPCSDGVGVVTAVGAGVTSVHVGDRVATLFAQAWPHGDPSATALRSTLGSPGDGVLAERVELDAAGVSPVPEYLDDVEAATLPCAALTAFSALFVHGRLTPADVVLVQGSGGVSLFALQLARLAGARVIATSKSREKLARMTALGASDGIDYVATPRWGKLAKELTGKRGVDHVIEVGGAGTLGESLRAVRPGGTVHLIGVLAGGGARPVDLTPVLMQNIRIQGVFVGSRASFEAMGRLFAAHRLRPVVDRVFPFEQAPEAFAYLFSAQHFGKVCITRSG